jgi:hypothetical protein
MTQRKAISGAVSLSALPTPQYHYNRTWKAESSLVSVRAITAALYLQEFVEPGYPGRIST